MFVDRPDLGQIVGVEAPLSRVVECGKCHKPISVGKNVVMAFCGDCSAELGKKR